jgi:hypothetical protein
LQLLLGHLTDSWDARGSNAGLDVISELAINHARKPLANLPHALPFIREIQQIPMVEFAGRFLRVKLAVEVQSDDSLHELTPLSKISLNLNLRCAVILSKRLSALAALMT